jgi:hypothetical protein
MSENRFDFLKDLVATVQDVQGEEDLAETPTPCSSASNQQFVYPPVLGSSSSSGVRSTPSFALGAPPPQESESEQENNEEDQQYPPQQIAGMLLK